MSQSRRLAAILAADVAGYSRLMGADEEGTLERLKALRRELLDPKIAEHKGRIVKTTGDGMLVEFASVVDAVRCAVAVQQAMPERNTDVGADSRIELRIGINLGDVIVEGDDLYGDGVNIAARIEALADPGGVFVSNTVHDHVRDRLPFLFEDLGEQQVKNIARPVRVYRVRPSPPLPGLDPGITGEGSALGARVGAAELVLPIPDKPSIAVLPFANMSGDPEQEYFADGMVEEIVTALSRIRWFFVIARNSSFTYKGQAVDVKQVGRELGVRYVLEGSVRKSGGRVRITAQLVDAKTGNHVWAERYDRDFADIFAVQDEITARVVATIEPELYAAENFRSQRKPPESLDAWECVIRALYCVGEVTPVAIGEAEALCRRAIAIAPGYGQAHSLLAWILVRRVSWSSVISAVLPEALAEARAALAVDERDPWAHLANGLVLWRIRRPGEAERAFRRALELNPNFALAYAYLGAALIDQGSTEDAITNAQYAFRLSPSDGAVALRASLVMFHAHFNEARYADAMIWARNTTERYPEHPWAYVCLTASAAMLKDTSAATAALASAVRIRPDFSLTYVRQSIPFTGEPAQRFCEGLRVAGVPRVVSQTRRLAAILAADVAGYSRLMGADEEGTLERLKALRRELVDPKIAEHHGRIVKTTGDGLLVEFASVVDAVRCAVAVQQAMPERDTGVAAESRIELRIGINLGDVIVEGDDLYGDGVNIAARIEALADAGSVFVSNTVHDQVRDRLPLVFEDLGEQQVKNITRPVRVYRVRDVGAAVKSPLTPVLQLPDKPSIAVLPFANMSGDPEQEYFADGMVEEIITALSRIRWLFVIARNSTFTYKGQAVDVKQVGRELGVRYVLEGSVRKAGTQVRITGQLIDATNGAHLWADRFDGSLEDVFELQDKVAVSVAGVIEPALQAAEIVRSANRPTNDLTAYDLYLRALANFPWLRKEQLLEARDLLAQAIARDPRYGLALAWAGICHFRLCFDGWAEDPVASRHEAIALAEKALAVADDDAGILANAALVLGRSEEDISTAIALIDRSLALNPSSARGWYASGFIRVHAGQYDAAIEHLERSLRLSPRGYLSAPRLALGMAHFFSGRFAQAAEILAMSTREGASAATYCSLASCYGHMGRLDEARAVIERLRAIAPNALSSSSVPYSNPKQRELFLSGLRLAAGEET